VHHPPASTSQVVATVTEVLPQFGLAHLVDAEMRAWTVTKGMPGAGIDTLEPGRRVTLSVADHGSFAIASGYAPLV